MPRDPSRLDPAALANPVHAALTGPQRDIAESHGAALRYPPAMTAFFAVPDAATASDWADAARLLADGAPGFVTSADLAVPADWTVLERVEGAVMTAPEGFGELDDRLQPLGPDDAADMVSLGELTHPGPVGLRTVELGGYVGVRDAAGELVAMGGFRFYGPGWRELSAICTAPAARGRGTATRILRHLAAVVEGDGEVPLLHVITTNPALGLYRRLGFATLRTNPGALVVSPLA